MQIYLFQNEQQVGPYTPDQLQGLVTAGQIPGETPAWHEGCNDWLPLKDIISQSSPQATSPPPPIQEANNYITSEQNPASRTIKSGAWLAIEGIGKVLVGIGSILGVIFLWIFKVSYEIAKWLNVKRQLYLKKHYAGNYFYQMGDEAVGPYKFGELIKRIQAGDVKSTTQVWREDINQWSPLSSYSEFKPVSNITQVEKPTSDVTLAAKEPPTLKAAKSRLIIITVAAILSMTTMAILLVILAIGIFFLSADNDV